MDSIDACEPVIILDLNEFNNPLLDIYVSTLVSNGFCTMTNAHSAKFIDVYDLNGRRLLDLTNNGKEEMNLDFSSLKSGVYIIVLNTRQFKKRTFKVVVN